jgi:ketosteroid isomerase-like protein
MDDARIRKIYDEVDGMRMEGFLAALTDDIKVTFGNHPTAVGKDQVRGAIGAFWSSIGGLRHRFTQILHDRDQAALEAQIDYTRKDGKVVTVPCVTMLRARGELISDMRIHIDVAPVYAP